MTMMMISKKNDGKVLSMPRSNLTIHLRGDCSKHDFGNQREVRGVQRALMSSVPYYRYNTSGIVPQVKPRQKELTLARANLTRVTSPPSSTTGGSLISFPSFTFPGTPYRIFLLFLPWLPCHFYLVVITTTTSSL